MEIWLFNLQHTSVLKAPATVEPRQHISNIYIYLYVSDQSVIIGSEIQGANKEKSSTYFAMALSKSDKVKGESFTFLLDLDKASFSKIHVRHVGISP